MPPRHRRLYRVLVRLRRLVRGHQLTLLLLAVVIGGAAGAGAIGFREMIALTQRVFFGSGSERLYSVAVDLAWWQILLAPAAGGLLVGLFIAYVVRERRPLGVADVIEATTRRGGRMSLTAGLMAAVTNAASLGVGGSAGREGPVVHLGASLGAWLAKRLRLGRSLAMTLLGCGVAAAVAASFNAPIAGVFFALEVVVGHYALGTFAPVVIASVSGTIVSRIAFGDFPAFALPEHPVVSTLEFPAFALLGVVSAGVAIVFMRSVFFAQDTVARIPVPQWLRPAGGGLAVGAIALAFPQILGVGYEATDMALKTLLPLYLLVGLVVAKTAATAITLGCGFGGGVFSPSLFIGAMVGGAFGVIATGAFPELSSGYGAYAIAGMGAVAAAVLGAPISTILIIFELTGDYALTLAFMVSVVVASLLTRAFYARSFFAVQLERRGVSIEGGREEALLQSLGVREVMRRDFAAVRRGANLREVRETLLTAPRGELFVVDDEGRFEGIITLADLSEAAFDTSYDDLLNAGDVARLHPPDLEADEDVRSALNAMHVVGEPELAVVENHDSMKLVGYVLEGDLMRAYNRAVLLARAEERGE